MLSPCTITCARSVGGWHLGTAIAVPNGDTLVVNIERRHTQGAFRRDQPNTSTFTASISRAPPCSPRAIPRAVTWRPSATRSPWTSLPQRSPSKAA